MIKIEKLSKIYKSGGTEIRALDNIDLEVQKGEFLIITGKSGSGKSTLLYQLGLLDFPDHGFIHINEIDVLKLSREERTRFRLKQLGYVFQDYAILPSLSALENVILPLLMQGKNKKEAEIKAIKSLEQVGLGDRIHNLPSQLSGGQQQRVSIARAIAHEPAIIFADEPTANLDSETSKEVLGAFLELHRKGQTIVMVTHEKDYAILGDRIIELKDGKIIADNKPRH